MFEAAPLTDRETIIDGETAAIALDMIGVPVMVLTPDGTVTRFSQSSEKLTGRRAADVIGRHVWAVLAPPDEKDAVRRAFAEPAAADGHRPTAGSWVMRVDGGRRIEWSYRVVPDRAGTVSRVVIIGIDLTPQSGAMAEDHERAALLHSIISTCPDAIVVIDESGAIHDFSPQAERMFGYGARDVIGRNISTLMPEPYGREHDGYLARYFETGEKRIIGRPRELVAQKSDDSVFPIELTVDEVLVDGRRLFMGFIRDISSRKRVEDEMRKLNAELIHAGRVAVMGEMAAAITHEINQPLTAISNYVAACRRMLEKPEARIDAVQEIAGKAERQVERARDIVRHFRSFVRKGQPERREEDLNGVVEEALALALAGARESGIKTEITLAPGLPPVMVDGVQIQQVILNLARNAIDALGEVERRRMAIATSWHEGQSAVEFAIRDSGPGLAPEIKDKLFQPFMTTKKNGTGIGLSLCRSIISAHKGRIWAESNDWGGTTFRFVLPMEPGPD